LGALVDEKTLVTGGLEDVSLARLAADMIAVHGMETPPHGAGQTLVVRRSLDG
jgi:hypothetical protein